VNTVGCENDIQSVFGPEKLHTSCPVQVPDVVPQRIRCIDSGLLTIDQQ